MTAPTAPPTSLSRLLAGRCRDGDGVHYQVGADWTQGRTVYGGLIAALAVQAMRDHTGADGADPAPLRALQTNFAAPLAPGAMRVDTQVLRVGRSARQLLARVHGGDTLCTVLLAVFGDERPSALVRRQPAQPAAVREADASTPLPVIPGLTPPFLQHLDVRWADGPPPTSGGPGYTNQMYARLHDQAADAIDTELLTVLLADVPPTPVLGHFTTRARASSVTWALEPHPVVAADGWWRADTEALAVAGGLVNQHTRLWAPDGTLAAFATQLVAVYG